MDATPRRRWFQFGLRALFVSVTVFALWLGYFGTWIRERAAFLHDYQSWAAAMTGDDQLMCSTTGIGEVTAPRGLWLFGAPGVGEIYLQKGFKYGIHGPEDDWEWIRLTEPKLRALFPEAKITVFPGPRPPPPTPEK